jgi:hypothetical protein
MKNATFLTAMAALVLLMGFVQVQKKTTADSGLRVNNRWVAEPDYFALAKVGPQPLVSQVNWAADATEASQPRGKQSEKGKQKTAPKTKTNALSREDMATQSKSNKAAVGGPARQSKPAFDSVNTLLASYLTAESIEIRVDKGEDYTEAVAFYQKAFGNSIPKTNDYSSSWVYTDKLRVVEFLVINTKALPSSMKVKNLKKGVLGFVRLENATTPAQMNVRYNTSIATGAFEEEERPGSGPKGERDSLRNTVRAVLKIKSKPSAPAGKRARKVYKLPPNRDYDYVIINPPVP